MVLQWDNHRHLTSVRNAKHACQEAKHVYIISMYWFYPSYLEAFNWQDKKKWKRLNIIPLIFVRKCNGTAWRQLFEIQKRSDIDLRIFIERKSSKNSATSFSDKEIYLKHFLRVKEKSTGNSFGCLNREF